MKQNLKGWFEVFFNPKSIKKYKGNIKSGILNVLIAGIICGIIYGIFVILNIIPIGEISKPLESFVKINVGLAFISILIYTAISAILSLIISSAIFFFFAKNFFNGKGNYSKQTFAISLPFSLFIIIYYLIGWIPIAEISFLKLKLNMLTYLYYLYPLTIILKEIHKYKTYKAILTWFIPTCIIIIISFLLAFF